MSRILTYSVGAINQSGTIGWKTSCKIVANPMYKSLEAPSILSSALSQMTYWRLGTPEVALQITFRVVINYLYIYKKFYGLNKLFLTFGIYSLIESEF